MQENFSFTPERWVYDSNASSEGFILINLPIGQTHNRKFYLGLFEGLSHIREHKFLPWGLVMWEYRLIRLWHTLLSTWLGESLLLQKQWNVNLGQFENTLTLKGFQLIFRTCDMESQHFAKFVEDIINSWRTTAIQSWPSYRSPDYSDKLQEVKQVMETSEC